MAGTSELERLKGGRILKEGGQDWGCRRQPRSHGRSPLLPLPHLSEEGAPSVLDRDAVHAPSSGSTPCIRSRCFLCMFRGTMCAEEDRSHSSL